MGVTTGRGTGDDLVVGTGAGLPGRGVEKAGLLVMKLARVNIVNSIMLLVFIFLIAQAPDKILCRHGDRTFVAGTIGA